MFYRTETLQKGVLEKAGGQELPAVSPGHPEYKKKSQLILKLNSCTNQGFISSPAALPTPRGTEHDDIVDTSDLLLPHLAHSPKTWD